MAVADPSSVPRATPEECTHTAAVAGVMAHEFGHYSGAQGPEGKRRTVTYYGPVMGGLPIQALHCPSCGVLKLTYPDGRLEERRLHPGRQAGLIAEASIESPEARRYGLQPRVSGLSISGQLAEQMRVTRPRVPRRRFADVVDLPRLDAVTWVIVAILSCMVVALLGTGYLATYDWTTPGIMAPFVGTLAAGFGLALALFAGGAIWRHYGPDASLSPSIAQSGRGAARMDALTRWVVSLFSLSLAGLLVAGSLAVYAWTTPDAELPVIIATVACAGLGIVMLIGGAAAGHFRRR